MLAVFTTSCIQPCHFASDTGLAFASLRVNSETAVIPANGKGSAMQGPRRQDTRQAVRRDVVKISGTHEGQREAWRSAAAGTDCRLPLGFGKRRMLLSCQV